MKPYYDEDGVVIYHGDCLAIIGALQADVMVTDPPYGMAYRSWSGARVRGDGSVAARDAALELWHPRPAIAFGRWSVERPRGVRLRLIWDKGEWPGMGDLALPWGPSDEEIYVIGEGWSGKRMGSVYRSDRMAAQDASHPTQKPVQLLERIIERCPPGVVLDPFMGSGTTLVAAKNLGRRAVGIEIEEKYCEIAAKRCSQGVFDFSNELADNRVAQHDNEGATPQGVLLEAMGGDQCASGPEDL